MANGDVAELVSANFDVSWLNVIYTRGFLDICIKNGMNIRYEEKFGFLKNTFFIYGTSADVTHIYNRMCNTAN